MGTLDTDYKFGAYQLDEVSETSEYNCTSLKSLA